MAEAQAETPAPQDAGLTMTQKVRFAFAICQTGLLHVWRRFFGGAPQPSVEYNAKVACAEVLATHEVDARAA